MRIAIFTDTFAPEINGVARTLHRLTDYLSRNDIEYLVFAPGFLSYPLRSLYSLLQFTILTKVDLALYDMVSSIIRKSICTFTKYQG